MHRLVGLVASVSSIDFTFAQPACTYSGSRNRHPTEEALVRRHRADKRVYPLGELPFQPRLLPVKGGSDHLLKLAAQLLSQEGLQVQLCPSSLVGLHQVIYRGLYAYVNISAVSPSQKHSFLMSFLG
jgi:hypothetical protein